MKTSSLFKDSTYKGIEKKIKEFLNKQDRKELRIIGPKDSPRTTGDMLPKILATGLEDILEPHLKKFTITKTGKPMENYVLDGKDGFTYHINVTTNRIEKSSSPNICAVSKLTTLYDESLDYKKVFVVLLVKYSGKDETDFIKDVTFLPVEYISWECLGLAALGQGQLQITRIKEQLTIQRIDRQEWMMDFASKQIYFYTEEAQKNLKRVVESNKLRDRWRLIK